MAVHAAPLRASAVLRTLLWASVLSPDGRQPADVTILVSAPLSPQLAPLPTPSCSRTQARPRACDLLGDVKVGNSSQCRLAKRRADSNG